MKKYEKKKHGFPDVVTAFAFQYGTAIIFIKTIVTFFFSLLHR
jgi:hypothetical protein